MATGTWGGAGDRHPIRVNVTWNNGFDRMQTGFYLRAAGVTVGDTQAAAEAALDWCNTLFKAALRPDQRILKVDAVDIVSRTGHAIEPVNMVGTANVPGNENAPGFLAVVLAFKSGLRTRYGQGRMFLPVTNTIWADGDSLSPTGFTAMTNVVNDLTSRFTGNTVSGYNLINVHGPIEARLPQPGRPGRDAIPASWYDVTTWRLSTAVTSVRSRKAGVGS